MVCRDVVMWTSDVVVWCLPDVVCALVSLPGSLFLGDSSRYRVVVMVWLWNNVDTDGHFGWNSRALGRELCFVVRTRRTDRACDAVREVDETKRARACRRAWF